MVCGTKELSWRAHLFCANFASCVGAWTPCLQADNTVGFHVYQSAAGGELNDEDADRITSVWRNAPLDPNKFHQARMGDHLMVLFKCGREPIPNHAIDRKAEAMIRRMIFDSFWSRASSTVRAKAKAIQKGCLLSATSEPRTA